MFYHVNLACYQNFKLARGLSNAEFYPFSTRDRICLHRPHFVPRPPSPLSRPLRCIRILPHLPPNPGSRLRNLFPPFPTKFTPRSPPLSALTLPLSSGRLSTLHPPNPHSQQSYHLLFRRSHTCTLLLPQYVLLPRLESPTTPTTPTSSPTVHALDCPAEAKLHSPLAESRLI